MPIAVLLAMPVVEHLALVQLVLADSVGSAVELATAGITILASAWLTWRLALVVAEGILAWPRVGPEIVDPHIVRAGAGILGIIAAGALLTFGADRVGLPLYGILAGLGVGGLAVALAAQSTLENLIGGISLVADKAVRRGELCKYGDAQGTVEAVGIRSTRIRGEDRTLTNIPNALLAKMPIVSLARRDQMLIQAVLGLRCETSPEQLRHVLVKLREMLLGDPRIDPASPRVRFIGFGAYTLDIEVFAYVMTRDFTEFLGIREDLLLRVMDILEQGGTELAYPTQMLHVARDHGNDATNAKAAETDVRQ
jgi:MscS family membrane protein